MNRHQVILVIGALCIFIIGFTATMAAEFSLDVSLATAAWVATTIFCGYRVLMPDEKKTLTNSEKIELIMKHFNITEDDLKKLK